MKKEKLVRDKIINIIQQKEGVVSFHRADDREYAERLLDKLQDELFEAKEVKKSQKGEFLDRIILEYDS